jgi:hypothetical protein
MVREKKTCVCAQRCRDRGSVSPPPLLEWSPERGGRGGEMEGGDRTADNTSLDLRRDVLTGTGGQGMD